VQQFSGWLAARSSHVQQLSLVFHALGMSSAQEDLDAGFTDEVRGSLEAALAACTDARELHLLQFRRMATRHGLSLELGGWVLALRHRLRKLHVFAAPNLSRLRVMVSLQGLTQLRELVSVLCCSAVVR